MINLKLFPLRKLLIVLSVAALLILFVLNLATGSVSIPLKQVFLVFSGQGSEQVVWTNILLRTRLPQTIVALFAGMGLGVAGLLMQTLFRNPLAGPSVLGISSGASLGVGFVLLVAGQVFGISFVSLGLWGDVAVIAASLAGAIFVLFLILIISGKVGGNLSVLIMGVMIGYLSNSIVGIMKFYSVEEDVRNYVIWGLGSFGRVSQDKAFLFAGITLLLCTASLFLGKALNLLLLGENYARNLGLRIKRSRFLIIMVAGIITAWITAFCGPIVFIGLAVPHLAKMISRTSNHFYLVVNCCLLGAATALLCNLVARLPGMDSELPINSVTAFVGAPVVISVIWKRRKKRLMER